MIESLADTPAHLSLLMGLPMLGSDNRGRGGIDPTKGAPDMAKPPGAPAHRPLIAFCGVLILAAGFTSSLHSQPASRPPAPIVDAATGSRAILHVDVVGAGANRRLVTAAVFPEGRRVRSCRDSIARSWGRGRRPRGSWTSSSSAPWVWQSPPGSSSAP